MSRTIIIDASSFQYRAFHASKERQTFTKEGVPNAGVILLRSMLERLQRSYSPTYMCAAFDSKTPTFRSALYPQYKAQRSKPDENYIAQIPGFRSVFFPMPCYQKDGYEADDIIGTLCYRILKDCPDVLIASGDKDMAQLVGVFTAGEVQLLNTGKDRVLNSRGVYEEYGVYPQQIADYLALVGDECDNVPGGRGIGPVGALALLKQFKNVEQIISHAGEIESSGLRKAVRENADMILLSKKLVTIDCDVPGVI